jgi:hypothetical protein
MAQSVSDYLRSRGVTNDQPGAGPDTSRDTGDPLDRILKRRGSTALAGIARAIYGQESNGGKADTSKPNSSRVRGPMQVQDTTFEQMRREGRIPADYRWDNPEHNLEAGVAYVEYLNERAGGDPVKIAQGYYGGPGAIGKPDRRDPKNPKAPTVGQYAEQVVARMGATASGSLTVTPAASVAPNGAMSPSQYLKSQRAAPVATEAAAPEQAPAQAAAPATGKPMPWMDVRRHPAYLEADDTAREQIRNLYWEQQIAPLIPPDVQASARQEFDASTTGDGRLMRDLGASFGVGSGALVSGMGYLWGLATGNEQNTLTELGQGAQDYWQDRKSLALRGKEAERQINIEAAPNEWAAAGSAIADTITDPRMLASFGAEQIPMFVPGAGAGRAAMVASRAAGLGAGAAGAIGTGAAVGTGAALQGADAAQATLEEVTQLAVTQPEEVWSEHDGYRTLRERGMSHQQAAASIATSLAKQTFAAGATASALLALLPGGRIIERTLIGAGKKLPGGVVGGAARGFIGESINEGLDEGASRVATNAAVQQVDPSRTLEQGVGSAAGLGAVMGGVMGGPAGAIEGYGATPPAAPAPPPAASTGAPAQTTVPPAGGPSTPTTPPPPSGGTTPPAGGPTPRQRRPRSAGPTSPEGPIPASEVLGPVLDGGPVAPAPAAPVTPESARTVQDVPEPAAPVTENAPPVPETAAAVPAPEPAPQPAPMAQEAPSVEPAPAAGAGNKVFTQDAADAAKARLLAKKASLIEQAANEAATSPTNDTPAPTDAQKEAGNYKKGHVRVQGLDLAIENPKGSTRSGTGKDGKPWSVTLPGHYGYIKGTIGKDKDHIDVTLGPDPENTRLPIVVMNQVDPDSGKFDEHKVFIGYEDAVAAQEAYRASFEGKFGQKMLNNLHSLTQFTPSVFKDWLIEGDKMKPAKGMTAAQVKAAFAEESQLEQQAMDDELLQAELTEAEAGEAAEEGVSRPFDEGDLSPLMLQAAAYDYDAAVEAFTNRDRAALEAIIAQHAPKGATPEKPHPIAEAPAPKPDKAKLVPKRTEGGGVQWVAEPVAPAPQAVEADDDTDETDETDEDEDEDDDNPRWRKGPTHVLPVAEIEAMRESYSADTLADKKPHIRGIFEAVGKKWVNIGGTSIGQRYLEVMAREIVPAADYEGVDPNDKPIRHKGRDYVIIDQSRAQFTPPDVAEIRARADHHIARSEQRSEAQHRIKAQYQRQAVDIVRANGGQMTEDELVAALKKTFTKHQDLIEDAVETTRYNNMLAHRYVQDANEVLLLTPEAAKAYDAAAKAAYDAALPLADRVLRFFSGMSRIGDLTAGNRGASRSKRVGVGVDVGEISRNGIAEIANAVVDGNQVFIDSGAFSLFKRSLAADGDVAPLDFDAILAKYDEIMERIAEVSEDRNGEDEMPEEGRVLMVMPDIVGNQTESIELARKYKDWIAGQTGPSWARPIVPIQKGELSLADAHAKLVKILGTDHFIVGIPSNEKAVSNEELEKFLTVATPKEIHFLGSMSPKKLEPKLAAIEAAGYMPEHISADANGMRAKLWGRQLKKGGDRKQAVQDAVAAEATDVRDEPAPKGTAPEHKRNKGKKLDKKTVYEPVAKGNPVTVEAELGDVQDITIPLDDFKEITDEWAEIFADPLEYVSLETRENKGQIKKLDREQADARIQKWKHHAKQQGNSPIASDNASKTILSLFDYTGEWARPWAEAGYTVVPFDIQHDENEDVMKFSVEYFTENMDITEVYGIIAACPCTDFASSGARHFAAKDADGRTEASKELVFQTLRTIEYFKPAFWALENPVGRIEGLTGLPKARMSFDPYHFGAPYNKKTMLWGKFNAELPTAMVEPTEGSKMHAKYGGKSQATKNARSETPEGFAYAFFMANNWADKSAATKMIEQYPEASGAIKAAFNAGVHEDLIRDTLYMTYEYGEPEKARAELARLVQETQSQRPTRIEVGDRMQDVNGTPNVVTAVDGDSFTIQEEGRRPMTFDGRDIDPDTGLTAGLPAFEWKSRPAPAKTDDEIDAEIERDLEAARQRSEASFAPKVDDDAQLKRKWWNGLTGAERFDLMKNRVPKPSATKTWDQLTGKEQAAVEHMRPGEFRSDAQPLDRFDGEDEGVEGDDEFTDEDEPIDATEDPEAAASEAMTLEQLQELFALAKGEGKKYAYLSQAFNTFWFRKRKRFPQGPFKSLNKAIGSKKRDAIQAILKAAFPDIKGKSREAFWNQLHKRLLADLDLAAAAVNEARPEYASFNKDEVAKVRALILQSKTDVQPLYDIVQGIDHLFSSAAYNAVEKGGTKTGEIGPKTAAAYDSPEGKERSAELWAVDAKWGKDNKVFTREKADAARARLLAKRGQLSAGLDPEMVQDGLMLAGYHIESGVRSFADFVKKMVADLGEEYLPYLRGWYMAAMANPDVEAIVGDDETTDVGQVKKMSVEDVRKLVTADDRRSPPETAADRRSPPESAADRLSNANTNTNTAKNRVVVTHVTQKGKTLRGTILTGVTKDQAKEIDKFTWSKDGGYFIREEHFAALDAFEQREQAAPNPLKGNDSSADGRALDPKERQFVNVVKLRLAPNAEGEPIATLRDARALHQKITGADPDGPAIKRVDELVELAVVETAREVISLGYPPLRTFEMLQELYASQPKLTTRTSSSVEQQAYSTPAPLAYLASRLAGINWRSQVYEPTAGNGMLLIAADPKLATVNELNDGRATNLREQGFQVTQKDATDFVPQRSYDAVIANPPFGVLRDAQGTSRQWVIETPAGSYSTTEIDHKIAMKALSAMMPDGKAVLILGGLNKQMVGDEARAEGYSGLAKRKFYYHLYQTYNVTDHFTVAGELYERQGAGWPVDVIVIEGKGKSKRALPAVDVPRVYDNWEALAGLTERPNERKADNTADRLGTGQQPRVPDAGNGGVAPRRPADVGRPDGLDRPTSATTDRPLRGPAISSGAAEREPAAGGPVAGSPGETGVRGGISGRVEPERGNEPAPARSDTARPAGPDAAPSAADGAPRSALDLGGGSAEPGSGARPLDQSDRTTAVASEGQTPYTPRSKVADLQTLVPVNMKAAIEDSLDALIKEVGPLDEYVAAKLGYDVTKLPDYFGAEQVDALALAIAQVERDAGFIIGDQTGIGKGRVVAAMIRYAIKSGLTPIFVTEKPNLYGDMMRDLEDVGVKNIKPLMTNAGETVPYGPDGEFELKSAGASKHSAALQKLADEATLGDYDVVFTTYNQMQMIAGAQAPRHHLLTMLAPNALIIFDESHNAGGQTATRSNRRTGDQAGEKTGRAGFARALIAAAKGVFYSSATYAKRPDVMDLYSKTDMALAVETPDQLPGAIAAGGVPLQQVVASMLAKAGQYIRRERTFDGVEYNTPLVPVDKGAADQLSSIMASVAAFDGAKQHAMATIKRELRAEAGAMGADNATGATGATSINFTSVMHNVIDQMLLTLKIDAAAEKAIEALKRGEKPVITVANTMGAFIESYVDSAGLHSGDAVELDFRAIMLRYLERSRQVTIKDVHGGRTQRPLTDEELGLAGLAAYNATRRLILNAAGIEAIPISPIDRLHYLLQKAGYKTGEITGRSHTIEYGDNGEATYKLRPASETKTKGKIATITGFNNGDTDVVILNQSGATGLSLHASAKFKNKQRRRMIIAQAERNIDTHMQMLGRVHRTGQVIPPAYDQLVADIPAEKRPAAVLAKKMASLNANTTASRTSALTAKDVPDFMNEYGDQVVAQLMNDMPEMHEALLEPLDDSDEGGFVREDAARKVTGRIPLLPVEQQERLYDMIESGYADLIEQENALGTNKLEAKTLDLDAKTSTRHVIFDGDPTSSSPFAGPANMEKVSVKKIGKAYTADQARIIAAQKNDLDKDASWPQIKQAGAIRQRELLDNARLRYSVYRDGVLADMANRMVEEPAIAARGVALDAMKNRVLDLLDGFQIGETYKIGIGQDLAEYGVLVDISQKKGWSNPTAPGTWVAHFLIASGSKKIDVTAASLLTNDGLRADRANYDDDTGTPILDLFDSAQTVMREDRFIATGNLLAAFAQVSDSHGQVTNFTDDAGRVRQGVLMPKKFKFEAAAHEAQKPVYLSPQAALDYLTEARSDFRTARAATVESVSGPPVKIQPAGYHGVHVIVPKAKGKGGVVFLDQGLRDIAGDFTTRGNFMVLQLDTDSDVTRRALAYIGKKWGPLVAKGSTRAIEMAERAGGTKTKRDVVYSRKGAPVFYSATLRTVEGAKQAKMGADQWEGWLRNQPGVKPEELDWIGLGEWLREQGGKTLTREQVAEFVRANQIDVREVVKGVPEGVDRKAMLSEQERLVQQITAAGYEIDGNPADGPFIFRQGDDEDIAMGGGFPTQPYVPPAVQRAFERYVQIDNQRGIGYDIQTPQEAQAAPKFERYTLPGGANYRELLLTKARSATAGPTVSAREQLGGAPREVTDVAEIEENTGMAIDELPPGTKVLVYPKGGYITALPDGSYNVIVFNNETTTHDLALAEAFLVREFGAEIGIAPPDDGEFNHSHWAEPNVLAHVRFNERTDADGKRVLFIEEIQSDWHQRGRKGGYSRAGAKEARKAEINAEIAPIIAEWGHRAYHDMPPEVRARYETLTRERDAVVGEVPDAPFKTTWPELALKRMIRWAAQNGFDRVAWTPGEVQADRYDLSQHLDSVGYSPRGPDLWNVTAFGRGRHAVWTDQSATLKVIEDHLGKEIAQKIADGVGRKDGPITYLENLDLKVGGEGMRGFYDKILRDTATKLIKKFGGKVGSAFIGKVHSVRDRGATAQLRWQVIAPNGAAVGGTPFASETEARTKATALNQQDAMKVHAFDVTPQMKEAALQGLPLFRDRDKAQAPGASVAQVYRWLKDQPLFGAVHVVKDIAALRRVVGDAKLESDTEGFYRLGDDKVYLVASEIPSLAKAEMLYRHEVEGHMAVELFGDVQQAVGDILASRSDSIASLMNEVVKTQPGLKPKLLAREVIALAAERGINHPVLARLIGRVRALLRKLGVKLEYSEADVRAVIARAARAATKDAARRAVRTPTGESVASRFGTIKAYGAAANDLWDGFGEFMAQVASSLGREPNWADWQRAIRKEMKDGPEGKNPAKVAAINKLLEILGQPEIQRALRNYHRSWDRESMNGVDLALRKLSKAIGVPHESLTDDRDDYNPVKDGVYRRRAPPVGPASLDHTGLLDAAFKHFGGKQFAKLITSPLYDRLIRGADRLLPEKLKQGFVADYGLPEPYLDAKIDKQAGINRVLRKTKNVLELLAGLDREQSRIAYLWMNEKPDTDLEAHLLSQLPEDSRAVVQNMKEMVDVLGREAVEVGLLTQESYDRNAMAYLHRSYKTHMTVKGESVQARHKKNASIRAANYKGRGLRDDVSPASLGEYELGDMRLRVELRGPRGGLHEVRYIPTDEAIPDGWVADGEWEIRWEGNKPGVGPVVGLWRDLTPEERQRLGEVEEVRFAFAKTMLNAIHDIENMKFLDWVGEQYAVDPDEAEDLDMVEASDGFLALKTYRPDQYVKVPSTGIPKTPSIKKYGKLAGKIIPAVMWNDIRNTMALPESDFARFHDRVMRAWKISKTALSPTVHVNNVMSNFILADIAEVRARDIARAIRLRYNAAQGDEAARELLARYEDSGAEQGSFHAMELQQDIIKPLLDELEGSEDESLLGELSAMEIVTLMLSGDVRNAAKAVGQKTGVKQAVTAGRKLIDLYRNEDAAFRLAKFLRELDAGRNDRDAGKAARDAFLNYEINAPMIQAARRTALPFIAFSYRAIPKMIETAAHKPWKLAKYLTVGAALNALAYTMLGMDKDDEDRERALLPEELTGRVLGVFPRLVRLPWHDVGGAPVFLDVRRWVPAGDMMDTMGSHGVVPLPNWLSLGGPLAFLLEAYANKSTFTGEPIVKDSDTAGQQAAKFMDYAFKWAAPNLPLPNPLNFVLPAGRDGDEPQFIDLGAIPGIDRDQLQSYSWTGILRAGTGREDAFGRESGSVAQAIASGFGFKSRSYPQDVAKKRVIGEMTHLNMEIDQNIRQLAKERARGGLTEAEFRERLEVEIEKKKDVYRETAGKLGATGTKK